MFQVWSYTSVTLHLAHKCTWSAGQNTQHPQSKSTVMASFWVVSGNRLGHPFTAECMLTLEHEDFSLSFISHTIITYRFFFSKMLYFFSAPECCTASSNPVMHPRHISYVSVWCSIYNQRSLAHEPGSHMSYIAPVWRVWDCLCFCLEICTRIFWLWIYGNRSKSFH